jgi:hypothetical protein
MLSLCLVNADFPISVDTSAQYAATAAFVNDQYYVFWLDQRYLSTDEAFSLFGCRITKDGTVLDTNGVELYRDSVAYNCDVAFDGNNFLIVTRNHC